MIQFIADGGLYNYVASRIYNPSDFTVWAVYYGFLALCIIIPYLIGSFTSSIFISRVFYHDDIRGHGSGNAGTTNMLRTFGWPAAIATFLCDALKTALAIFVSWLLMGYVWAGLGFSFSPGAYFAMLFCILGHIYPVYFRMKGGKGVLCAAVSIAMLSPWVFCILLIIFVGTVAFTKYVSLGSILCAAIYPLFLSSLVNAFGGRLDILLMLPAFLTAALLVFAHRSNIKRLYNHQENKLSFKRRHSDSFPSDEES